MFIALAEDYFSEYLSTATTSDKLTKAKFKAYTNYRKIITKLNKTTGIYIIPKIKGM